MIATWVRRLFGHPASSPLPEGAVLEIDARGVTIAKPLSYEPGPRLWRWSQIHEFGLMFGEAGFPDPWFGNYMEGQWFFTVEPDGSSPQREFIDVDWLPFEALAQRLLPHLAVDMEALQPGWKACQQGPKNFEGAGTWWGWRRAGWSWPRPADA